MENVSWTVIAPGGFKLTANDGDLQLTGSDSCQSYDRQLYLSKLRDGRQQQARQAGDLLKQASQLLQSGQQSKALWAFNNVANRNALDAASNEDARVQLENLQTQQAIVGLNSRRQRLYLDNDRSGTLSSDDDQLKQAAAANPVLQQQELNFQPQQLSQLLAGNTNEDNAVLQRLAGRLIQQQRTIDSTPTAMEVSLPEEGVAYRFSRNVQVVEDSPLRLDLQLANQFMLQPWQWAVLAVLLLIIFGCLLMPRV
jgi:hypothetical protein